MCSFSGNTSRTLAGASSTSIGASLPSASGAPASVAAGVLTGRPRRPPSAGGQTPILTGTSKRKGGATDLPDYSNQGA
jgi:hypothetical protein